MTPAPAAASRRAAARAAGDRRRHPHRDGVDRRHRDALDAGRRAEPRQLHLQRPADAQLHRRAGRLRRRRGCSRCCSTAWCTRSRSASRDGAAAGRRARSPRSRALYALRRAPPLAAERCGHATPRRSRIGAKTFTEQYILSEILAGGSGARPGCRREIAPSLGSTVAFDALRERRHRRLRRLLGHDLGDDPAPHRATPRIARRGPRRGRARSARARRHRAGRRRSASRTPTRSRCARRTPTALGIRTHQRPRAVRAAR